MCLKDKEALKTMSAIQNFSSVHIMFRLLVHLFLLLPGIAFAQDWSRDNCLLVPPVVLIPSVLRHIYLCKAKGALVFPYWPSSVFWPILWSSYRPWITGAITMAGSIALVQGIHKNSLLGSSDFNGLVCAIYIDCSEVLL